MINHHSMTYNKHQMSKYALRDTHIFRVRLPNDFYITKKINKWKTEKKSKINNFPLSCS